MGFPTRLLADHEKMVFDLRPHKVSLLAPVVWTVLLIVVFFVGWELADDNIDSEGTRDVIQFLLGVGCIAAILYLGVFPAWRWSNTHFVLTSDRLITRSGIIAKHSREIPLERINDVAFNQTVIERFIGAGDLLIESAGERGQSRITNVRKPEAVQLMIYKETEENANRMARGGLEARREATIPERIEALKRLVDQGAITEAEFETKKQELLKRL
jgi:uncharacterized membrane protein YdbT with pleckstrin-like domain